MRSRTTRRQKAPAWQQLAVAFADGDMSEVERLLQEPGLTSGDRIDALRRLGRDKQALTEARAFASGQEP